MLITYTEGHYSMDIDGTEFVELDYNIQKDICHKLVDKVSEEILQRYIEITCEIMGDYTDLGKCETCGDYIDEYKLEI